MSSDNRIPYLGTLRSEKTKGFALLAGLLALLVSAGCGGGSTSVKEGPVAASLGGTITAGTAPSAIAVDSTNNKIYVADFGSPQPSGIHLCLASGADIKVIDGATQSPTSVAFQFFDGALNPYAMTVSPTNHTFYVVAEQFEAFTSSCDFYEDGIFVFDTASLTHTKTLGTLFGRGGGYSRIGTNPKTDSIYVAGDGAVDVWDSNGNLVATIPVGSAPVGVAVNATSNKIYVANSFSNNISVIDGASNTVVATVTDPNAVAPVAVAINPTTNTIYVANSQSNNLTVIDGATNTVMATFPVGTSPSDLDVDSQTNFIYVANAGNSQSGDPGNITVINGVTNATQTLTVPKAQNPVAVAVNSATNKIYVANSVSNNVTVINGAHD